MFVYTCLACQTYHVLLNIFFSYRENHMTDTGTGFQSLEQDHIREDNLSTRKDIVCSYMILYHIVFLFQFFVDELLIYYSSAYVLPCYLIGWVA